MSTTFKLSSVVKEFPDFRLGPLDLELEPGTVLGYVGPNGSGKTTTMHLLTGLLRPDGGAIEVCGNPNDPSQTEWKQQMGFVGDAHLFYERWTGEKNLRFLSQFYPTWSDELVTRLAKRFALPLERKAAALSKGNRVKLALIAALAHSPRLLLLDEPTAGLDPVVRAEVLDVLFEVVESEERSIFYSTHILSDINRLVDEIAFLVNGQVVRRVAKDDLTDAWRRISFRLEANGLEIAGAAGHRQDGNDHQVVSRDRERTLAHLGEIGAENVHELRMSLEEIAVEILKGDDHVARS